MTHQNNFYLSDIVREELIKGGWGALSEMTRLLINNAMQDERARHIQIGEYERTKERKGYANGSNRKRWRPALGKSPL